MPREQSSSNIVYISGKFLDRKDDIRDAFQQHDVVELRAKDKFIEMGIQLSEHFVSKGWATYDQFRSSLATDPEGDSIPQVTIKLRYLPAEPIKEKEPEKKEYRQRERGQGERKQDKREDRGRGPRPETRYRN